MVFSLGCEAHGYGMAAVELLPSGYMEVTLNPKPGHRVGDKNASLPQESKRCASSLPSLTF